MPAPSSDAPNKDAPIVTRPTRLDYRAVRWAVRIAALLWCRFRCFHRDRVPLTGGVLLVCNHQSFLDPLLVSLGLNRECSFMARSTLWKNRWFGGLIAHFNSFPVKRDSADLTAVKETLRRLKAGECIIVFPEGTRTQTGRIGPLLKGVSAMAKKAGVPIVPVAITGAFDMWPRHARWPKSVSVWVDFGPPIDPAQIARQSHEENTIHLQAALETLHNALRQRQGLPPFNYGKKGKKGVRKNVTL